MDIHRLFIANARLIDGSGEDRGDRPYSLLVEGKRIAAIAPQGQLAQPGDATIVDAKGMTLMPGLIDCHDHLSAMEGTLQQRSQIPQSLAVLETARIMKETLLCGFTAVRDAGGLDWGLKLGVEKGLIQGPRLKISVNILSQSGGHNCHIEPAGIDSDVPKLPGVPHSICDGCDECRRRTREMIFAGADWIKLCTTGGVGTRTGGPLHRQFSLEEVGAIVDAAHAGGKPVMCHAYGGEGVDIALEAGVDSIEHGAALSDDQIERMDRQGTWLVPTFSVFRKILEIDAARPGALAEYIPRKTRDLMASQRESFRKILTSGVKVALGTDIGPFEHGCNAREFGYLVDAGMTPMQAIVAGTKMGARCMGIDDETGELKVGKAADLLLVDGDPLADIGVLADRDRLKLIMKDGDVIKNAVRA